MAEPTVGDLAYSPNGDLVAALIESADKACDQALTQVLVIPATGAAKGSKEFLLPGCATGRSLFWSPDSRYLVVEMPSRARVIRISDGQQCVIESIQHFGGFFEPEHMLAVRAAGRANSEFQNRFTFVDVYGCDCKIEASWQFPERVTRLVAFGPPGIALVVNGNLLPVLVDPATGRILKQLTVTRYNPVFQFGNGGRTLCAGQVPAGAFNLEMMCYDVGTGTEIMPPPQVRNGDPFDMARDSSVLVATDQYVRNRFLSFDSDRYVEHWVAWDLRKGYEIIRYKDSGQAYALRVKNRIKRWMIPSRVAISPDGRRVAVGSNDMLRVYKLE